MQPLWWTVWRFLKKLKMEFPYDPAILLLGIYPEKTNSNIYMHPSVHSSTVCKREDTEATEMSTNTGMDEGDAVHIYSGMLLSHKKNDIMPFAAWMDLETIILIEVSQRKMNAIWYHLYLESKKWYKWPYLQNRNRLTYNENKVMVTKGDSGGDKLGVLDDHMNTTIGKIGKQQGPTV